MKRKSSDLTVEFKRAAVALMAPEVKISAPIFWLFLFDCHTCTTNEQSTQPECRTAVRQSCPAVPRLEWTPKLRQ